jgi:tetratricopeptide (TPR) repeat protein/predicted Ser/Thr protein kinase
LFGDDASDHLRKQVIKARFLRNLAHPTGGVETSDQREGATEPSAEQVRVDPVRIDRFTVLRKLGQGGMGVVYAAYDEPLDRKVAIKLLHSDLSHDERGRARMRREAQALARLSHPNVVQVHEIGEWDGHDFVVMEFLDGQTLQEWLCDGEHGWKEALEVMVQAGRGLVAAHAAGLVHRDFKPTNLFVSADGRARVLDFGLARAIGEEVEGFRVSEFLQTVEERPRSAGVGEVFLGETSHGDLTGSGTGVFDKLLTVTGAVLGTPAYMAPEQHLGERATELSDQFSFCVVLYEALFGRRPYEAESLTKYAIKVTEGEFIVPGPNSGVPAWLRQAVCRGLAPVPSDRWASMEALLAELTRERGRLWKRSVVAAGLVASISVALAFGGGEAAAELCAADPGSVGDSWGEAQHERVRGAFERTGLEQASSALALTKRSLDAYADELVTARQGACEEHRVSGSQTQEQFELRMACLEQREGELRAVVEVFGQADAGVVNHASAILGDLGDIGMCAQVELLERNMPVPRDEEAAAEIAELRQELARARALSEADHIEESKALVASVRRRATHIGYLPLSGEVAFLEGYNARLTLDLTEASRALTRAASVAERTDHVELGASVWLELARLATLERENSQLPMALAETYVERLGHRPVHQVALHLLRARILEPTGARDEALDELDQALNLAEAGFLGSEAMLVEALVMRSSVLAALGRAEEARADLERALELAPNQARTATALFDLGVVELGNSRFEEARALLLEALAAFERIYGPDYDFIGHGRLALSQVAINREQLDEARHWIEQALEILDEDHEDHAYALDARASLRMQQGDYEGAIADARAALAHAARVSPEDQAYLGYLHAQLGRALRYNDDCEGAIPELDRAIDILDTDPPTLDVVQPLLDRGIAQRVLGQHHLARRSLERAVELMPPSAGYPRRAAEVRVELATTLAELGQHAQARELASEAKELLEAIPEHRALRERAKELAPD